MVGSQGKRVGVLGSCSSSIQFMFYLTRLLNTPIEMTIERPSSRTQHNHGQHATTWPASEAFLWSAIALPLPDPNSIFHPDVNLTSALTDGDRSLTEKHRHGEPFVSTD